MSSALSFMIDVMLLAVGALLWLPTLVLLVEVVAAAWPVSRRPKISAQLGLADAPAGPQCAAMRTRTAILVPAHDEAAGIAATIGALKAQLRPLDRLLVVADNCTDATARVARDSGAEVAVRKNASKRGKGYALAFGVDQLRADPPAVVVVVDADCIPEADCIGRLVARCVESGRPVQALYLMRSLPAAGVGSRTGEFAWVVKNQVRPRGSHRLGLPCQLMGTGMAFPWALIESAPLAGAHLVEDLQLGVDLALRGAAPLFLDSALVTSYFPSGDKALRSQRTRWEHGHLAVLSKEAPKLLWHALRSRRLDLAALALDLSVPPLASLALLWAAFLLAAGTSALMGGQALPLQMALAATGCLVGALVLAWWGHGRKIISAVELVSVPLYALRKLPLYAGFLRRRQTEWVRTERDDRKR